MSRDFICVSGDLGIDTLEELLLERDLSGVPVIDHERRLIGYATMTDIMREHHDRPDPAPAERTEWGGHTESAPKTVAEVMTPVALELQEQSTVAIAIELMTSRGVHRVPVVSNEGVLVGMITADAILRSFAKRATKVHVDEHTAEADRVVSLGFMTSGLAHQVNNALTPMRLSLGRLTSFELSRRPLSPERMHRVELLQDVREGLERIERIVRALKVFSHADEKESHPVDVCDALETALAVANHEIRHRAKLVRDVNPMPLVDARAEDLRQVFINLLINAVHAIPEGEAHVHEIRVTTWTNARGRAAVEIKDSGTGIPVEALPRIFEPFFTTHPGRALGLGLAVTRDLVASFGGEIEVDSVVGRGTAIRITLPPSEKTAQTSIAPHDERGREAEARTRLRILIVDDDRPVAAAIALELGEHDVIVAESGREALEILRRDKDFDVILCDLMMPEVTGMDVYESLRLIAPALVGRVVLMTGGAFTHRAGEFLSTVNAPVLEKPFESGQLQAIVNAIERQHELAEAPILAADYAVTTPVIGGREN
ncbi:MAG TPA: ATP-binding protein [Kofleriaceae bacterium]|nr:ATP-binding protein [Kofleriaceae bacterium]